ncbi:MAG: PAS domain-containing sensor histidine kinase [Actinobacteria bacterium]|nr:PAS domain-containing sensor histidine kinase [Actinomycetota bacterium]MCA1720031.1 PAS domain-containing sensor histidine kinase [Actinomycetota bacterium]
MPLTQRATSGKQASRLLLAAGALTLVNNYLPGAEHLNIAVLNTIGLVTVALGAGGLLVPWARLPVRAPLLLALVAFALIALADRYGGVSAFSYAVYFVVVFVWVGIGQPPRTSYWLAPVATAAYVVPFLLEGDPPTNAVASVTVAIPVCVLVGEVLARSVRRSDASRDQLRARVEVVERLATLTSEFGRDLDAEAVSRRMVDAAVEVFSAPSAAYGCVEGDDLVVTAVAGLPASLIGQRVPLTATRLMRAAAAERAVVTTHDDVALLPVPPGGSALTVACFGDGLLGGLTVVLDRPVATVTAADEDVLRLLGTQGAAALVNAARHDDVVRRRAREQDVVDALVDGVLVIGPDGAVSSSNRAAAHLLGRSQEELVGHPPPLPVGPPGQAVQHELAPGRWVQALPAVLPATGELVVALHDTSRQRALDEAKDLFLATTSHELRTPLTAVKGYVSMLQRRWDVLSDEARLEALATIAEQTDGLVELTNHLLMGARAGTAAHTAAGTAFDLGEVVARAVTTYARVSERHRLLADLPAALPAALGDPLSTGNVLGQLVENAIKYSPGGGDVTLAVRAEGGELAVEVLDRGVGVPAGREEALFTPFYQAAPANTREFGGVGLGLYIVRRLVEAQGGRVSAANRPGGGAVLRFTVPVAGGMLAS